MFNPDLFLDRETRVLFFNAELAIKVSCEESFDNERREEASYGAQNLLPLSHFLKKQRISATGESQSFFIPLRRASQGELCHWNFFLHLLDQNRWYIRRHCIIVFVCVCYVKGCLSWRVTFLSLVCSTAFRRKNVLLHYLAFLQCVDPNGKKCLAKKCGRKKAISVQVSNTLCVYVSLFSCLIRRKSDTPLSTCDLTLGDLKWIQKKTV